MHPKALGLAAYSIVALSAATARAHAQRAPVDTPVVAPHGPVAPGLAVGTRLALPAASYTQAGGDETARGARGDTDVERHRRWLLVAGAAVGAGAGVAWALHGAGAMRTGSLTGLGGVIVLGLKLPLGVLVGGVVGGAAGYGLGLIVYPSSRSG